jgi:hypothetical protein
MAELLSPEQVDMITGDYLGNPDSANWAMRLAPVLDIEYSDDSVVDVTLPVFDGDSGEDYTADSDPDSLGTKERQPANLKWTSHLPHQMHLQAGSKPSKTMCITSRASCLHVANSSFTAKEQCSLQTHGQQMICDLCNVSPAVWSNNA